MSRRLARPIAAGTLSLDDTVADVLPDLAAELPDIADITVEQLLAMQNGIPEYEFLVVPDVLENPTEVVDLDEVIVETVEGGVEPSGTAGYSTTNYLILGGQGGQHRLPSDERPQCGARCSRRRDGLGPVRYPALRSQGGAR